eukprot:TRINITY_DN67335_c2_g1_i1.p1 TRINITY_DN67335_c2_g1~~TRINITY_DN67335_c2_g1_i1.p1  ORF type:complete len:490 (-),score=81.65 TRINITY_DN67335_c2_g1_i1:318-1787(-)
MDTTNAFETTSHEDNKQQSSEGSSTEAEQLDAEIYETDLGTREVTPVPAFDGPLLLEETSCSPKRKVLQVAEASNNKARKIATTRGHPSAGGGMKLLLPQGNSDDQQSRRPVRWTTSDLNTMKFLCMQEATLQKKLSQLTETISKTEHELSPLLFDEDAITTLSAKIQFYNKSVKPMLQFYYHSELEELEKAQWEDETNWHDKDDEKQELEEKFSAEMASVQMKIAECTTTLTELQDRNKTTRNHRIALTRSLKHLQNQQENVQQQLDLYTDEAIKAENKSVLCECGEPMLIMDLESHKQTNCVLNLDFGKQCDIVPKQVDGNVVQFQQQMILAVDLLNSLQSPKLKLWVVENHEAAASGRIMAHHHDGFNSEVHLQYSEIDGNTKCKQVAWVGNDGVSVTVEVQMKARCEPNPPPDPHKAAAAAGSSTVLIVVELDCLTFPDAQHWDGMVVAGQVSMVLGSEANRLRRALVPATERETRSSTRRRKEQ